ncbi:MAG: LLM class flavin-dependent oxidoreductase [Acidimicrobiales bacterium]
MKVRIAVSPGGAAPTRSEFLAFIDGLERRGFDTVWLSDVPLGRVVDPLVGLALAAGRTERLKLGANVVGPGRNPLLLAKELAQLDRLSEGRLLLSFVPGQDQPAEREALGVADDDRGGLLGEWMGLCRRWWAGETVDHHSKRFSATGVRLEPRPVQDPLEIWLGGIGPLALHRAGRLADGWLTARATPEQAGAGRETILVAAAEAGRCIDPEHFGISIPYARVLPPEAVVAATLRRPGQPADTPSPERADILPVGAEELTSLLRRHLAAGLSKFVLRPLDPAVSEPGGWDAELDWLAAAVLPLQS